VAASVSGWPMRTILLTDAAEKPDAFAGATAAIAASGTVTLELALSGTPFTVGYVVNGLTAWIVARFVRVRFATIVNLVMDRAIVTELIQEACTADRLVQATGPLLALGSPARAVTIADLRDAVGRLGLDGPPPSERAARVVLELIATPP
ncbi:MAG: lipid-A-disaccharide synthase, partial [Alphaproteobacteria bacterium]